jgi:hypothetical protein
MTIPRVNALKNVWLNWCDTHNNGVCVRGVTRGTTLGAQPCEVTHAPHTLCHTAGVGLRTLMLRSQPPCGTVPVTQMLSQHSGSWQPPSCWSGRRRPRGVLKQVSYLDSISNQHMEYIYVRYGTHRTMCACAGLQNTNKACRCSSCPMPNSNQLTFTGSSSCGAYLAICNGGMHDCGRCKPVPSQQDAMP